jgi:hypothetical protein
MKLADLVSDANLLLEMKPEDLGLVMLRVLAGWPKAEAVQLSRFLSVSRSQYPPSLTRQVDMALMTAWAWLEGQAFLIPDTRYGEGVSMLSASAHKLVKELVAPIGDIMSDDDEISEAGAKARFARSDGASDYSILEPGGGGPLSPGFGDPLSRNFRANDPPFVSDVPPQAATPPAQKPAELFTLKPSIWGMSVDLKELGRRGLNWLRRLRR